MSSSTASIRNTNGVRVSPEPRRIADSEANMYRNGTPMKMIRR